VILGPGWLFVLGAALGGGGGGGVLLGGWLAWLTFRNPLGMLVRAYAELWADIVHLWTTGELRPGRLAPRAGRDPASAGAVPGATADAAQWPA